MHAKNKSETGAEPPSAARKQETSMEMWHADGSLLAKSQKEIEANGAEMHAAYRRAAQLRLDWLRAAYLILG